MESPEENNVRQPLLDNPAKKEAEEVERLCIDEMLQRYCGEFGRWQMKHFVLTCLAWALEAFHTMVMIFADQEPEWRCVGSDCRVGSSYCDMDPGSWEWTEGKGSSTVSEWGLICGDKYKVGLVQALFFTGCMIGAGVFGHLSDSKLGRKGSLTVVCIINAIFGIATAFSPNYWTYVVLRFLTGFSTGGVGLTAFVLATEPVGPSKRGVAGMSTFYFFSSGIALLSGVAYVFRSWRELFIVSSLPSLLFLLIVLPFIPESPRWYLIRGKVDKAMELMHSIARTNGRHIPVGVTLALDDDKENENGQRNNAVEGSLKDVLQSPLTRIRLLLAIAISFMVAIVYYGLSLNVGNLKTNLYLNVFLNAVTEMPAFGITAVLLDRYGRKPLTIGTQWFSCVFCVVGFVVGGVGPWKVVRMVSGVLGIFGMAGTYNLLFIYIAELFPTVVRNAALGCATQASQMGAILAPFVVVLGEGLPFGVFAVCGLVGGGLAFYLPETLNKPLYDTMFGMHEAESESNRGRQVLC
ncbi:hypothetical protein EUTSA_v10022015mg [Eutrema salsugineum]|uniref:Major facilitator superfamily (MFS) profile domain-containing protein n=1 Tax=Eutrema salsugineum TaxID=72664 RepID=V4LVE0_EUTSA|nr:organic cation/carnitine transporter 4 [Eutrema salsugineum]ESQ47814.1 hypothetical protein EUTSA_v10022015mg [Eutrema salsugineum]